MSIFNEFRPLDEKYLIEYIKSTPSLSSLLGDSTNLQIKEVGDGNLNFVYIVVSPSGSLVIKQVIFLTLLFVLYHVLLNFFCLFHCNVYGFCLLLGLFTCFVILTFLGDCTCNLVFF